MPYFANFFILYSNNKISFNNNYNYLNNKNIKKIKIAIYAYSIKNGGIERQTSLLLNNFNKIKIFKLYLFTIHKKEPDEYFIDKNIPRIIIKNNLIDILIQNSIDILIYQFYNFKQIKFLNNFNKTKTIIINRSCFLHWIYYKKYFFFKTIYKAYKNCKYLS